MHVHLRIGPAAVRLGVLSLVLGVEDPSSPPARDPDPRSLGPTTTTRSTA